MKLGKIQLEVLKCLKEHGRWFYLCGWTWDSIGGTRRTLDALVKKGAASVSMEAPYSSEPTHKTDVYTITPEGLKALEKLSV